MKSRPSLAKTNADVRDVDVQPELHEELTAWRARTPFPGRDELVFASRTGSPLNRQNVRQRMVLRAADLANVGLADRGLSTLPDGLSPHALRRSFASWLIVEGEDVAYVQAQLGHTDPTMTLGIYAQAVRSGRRSARSRRRLEALDRAPAGTSGVAMTIESSGEASA